MAKITFREVITFLNTTDLTPDERNTLVETMNSSRRWANLQATRSLGVGDHVEFDSKYGVVVQGKVTKVNRTTVHVLADGGSPWRVSPTLLRRVG